jgi:DNA gyrase subunit A
MISNGKVTVILTAGGYVKRMAAAVYKEQARGGKGIISINLKEGDHVKQIVTCNNKDYLICVSDAGKAYWLKAYNVPESGRYAEGKAIVNLLDIKDERIVGILDIKDFANSKIVFLTSRGTVKKTKAVLFSRPRSSGIRAITINNGDSIVDILVYSTEKDLIIATENGKAIKFGEETLRPIGRSGMGVRGIRLAPNDTAKNIIAAENSWSVLSVTRNGYGKVTPVSKYRAQGRGGKGVLNIKVNNKTGRLAKILPLKRDEPLILISSSGISITIPTASIRITGRSASGVRLMKLDQGATVVDAKILEEEQA